MMFPHLLSPRTLLSSRCLLSPRLMVLLASGSSATLRLEDQLSTRLIVLLAYGSSATLRLEDQLSTRLIVDPLSPRLTTSPFGSKCHAYGSSATRTSNSPHPGVAGAGGGPTPVRGAKTPAPPPGDPPRKH